MSKYRGCLLGAILAIAAPTSLEAQLNEVAQSNESVPTRKISPTFQTRQNMGKALSALTTATKGEFESTSDFDAKRCDAFFKRTGASADTVFHFIVFGTNGPLSQPYYDADRQEYRFLGNEIFPSLYMFLSTKPGFGLILDRAISPGRSYIGQNAFGVAKKIDVSNESTIGVLVPVSRGPMTKITLHATSNSAKELKGNLRLIVSTKIAPPCIESGKRYSKPTIDLPIEITDNLTGLVGSSDATWEIIKSSTGEVLTSGDFK